MKWTYKEIDKFVAQMTKEQSQNTVEGPAVLGRYYVWRAWTFNGSEYNAHYVIGDISKESLALFENFQPFGNWLMDAFKAKDVHSRRLDWLRSIVASIIILTLLTLVVWSVINDKAADIDFKWLVGALAATALAYLLGDWVRKPL